MIAYYGTDHDGDGIPTLADKCPTVRDMITYDSSLNLYVQQDSNGNLIPDACDCGDEDNPDHDSLPTIKGGIGYDPEPHAQRNWYASENCPPVGWIPPQIVYITSPTNNQYVSGRSVSVSAKTPQAGTMKVEFYKDSDTTPFGTSMVLVDSGIQSYSPDSMVFSKYLNTVYLADGVHTLYAKAYNIGDKVGVSPIIKINVRNPDTTLPYFVSLNIYPAIRTRISGNVDVSALAKDRIGISKVEFYKDSDTTPFAIDTTSEYSYYYSASFDTTSLLNGEHTFYAKAYDYKENVNTSRVTSVIVDNIYGCVRAEPNMSISSRYQQGSAGTTLEYNLEFTNKDSNDCGASSFELYGDNIPVDWTTSFVVNPVSVNPGAKENIKILVTSSESASKMNYRLNLYLKNLNNETSVGTNYVYYTVI